MESALSKISLAAVLLCLVAMALLARRATRAQKPLGQLLVLTSQMVSDARIQHDLDNLAHSNCCWQVGVCGSSDMVWLFFRSRETFLIGKFSDSTPLRKPSWSYQHHAELDVAPHLRLYWDERIQATTELSSSRWRYQRSVAWRIFMRGQALRQRPQSPALRHRGVLVLALNHPCAPGRHKRAHARRKFVASNPEVDLCEDVAQL